MKLEPPLSELFDRCMTVCEAECCGIDAYDFHPAHVASFLLMYRGTPDAREITKVRSQLQSLRANYGSVGASQRGVTLEDLNQKFSGTEIDALVDRITSGLDAAIALLGQYDAPRSRPSH